MYRVVLLLLFSIALYAKGTSAGTVINNVATLDFIVDDVPEQIESNVVTDIVAQLLDLHIDTLDAQNVQIKEGVTPSILSFQITNTGNGLDRFSLSFLYNSNSDFIVNDVQLYVDSNDNKAFDTSDQNIQQITLKADQTKQIYLISTGANAIKMRLQTTQKKTKKPTQKINYCYMTLKGVSLTGGSGIAGKVYHGKGVRGVDALDGEKGGIAEAKGIWEYSAKSAKKSLTIEQKSTVLNQFGKSEPISGAVITYDVRVLAGENVHAKRVVYKNPIPKFTIYQKNSIKLDGKSLTDSQDSDKGFFDSKNNLIMVDLDHMNEHDTKKIQFKVKIK